QYGQPSQPGQPQYGQPSQPGQPQYGQQQYGQPGYQQACGQNGDVTTNLSINFWLSAFFSWLPAVIFYFMDKDKVPAITRSYAAANLNFQILRTLVGFGAWVIMMLIVLVGGGSLSPAVSLLFSLVIFGISIYLFVLQIMAAIKVQDCARRGEPADNLYPFNVNWVS
ncbi:MAG: DUF4870 domain-containing protein, partial [Gordonia sp. (in: high G+C Gram-positive bacteria)]